LHDVAGTVERGKFWEYHDQLFSASSLERVARLDYARTLKIDEKRFDSCLTSQKYKAEVQQDLQEGTQAGVSGTQVSLSMESR